MHSSAGHLGGNRGHQQDQSKVPGGVVS
jgi:hypothetical protein